MKTLATNVGKILICVLAVVIIAWSLFTVIGRLIHPTEYPMLFGYSEARILSGSMEPTLSSGDHVVFHRQERYEIDDVVVYYDEVSNIFVVHRIVGKSGDRFILQGDFNPICDTALVSAERIQGKVLFAIPQLQNVIYIGYGALGTICIQFIIRDIKSAIGKKQKEGGKQSNEA